MSLRLVSRATLNEGAVPSGVVHGDTMRVRHFSVLRSRAGHLSASFKALVAHFGLTLDASLGELRGAR